MQSYREFWPFYLGEHSRPGTRAMHLFGILLAFALLALAAITGDWRLLPAAIVSGYAFAWIGHAFIEHNQPATFRHPLWSLISDFRMLGLWLAGRLDAELKRHGVTQAGGPPPPSGRAP